MPESTREKIIAVSIDLFSQKGYADTSIRDIAKKAEIKTSSIYYHFKSKEAILDYIMNEYIKVVNDSRLRRRWDEKKDSIIAGESDVSTKEVMRYMFFSFEPPNVDRYRKMIKIICSEAIRNDTVSEHFRTQNNISFNYLKSILDSLLSAGKIPDCDTVRLAGILRAIPFAFMHLNSIDIWCISDEYEDTGMFSLLEYILKLVMEVTL